MFMMKTSKRNTITSKIINFHHFSKHEGFSIYLHSQSLPACISKVRFISMLNNTYQQIHRGNFVSLYFKLLIIHIYLTIKIKKSK